MVGRGKPDGLGGLACLCGVDQLGFAFPGLLARAQSLRSLVLERVAVHFGLRLVRGIRDHQQDGRQQIVRDQRRTAGRHIRQGQAGERNDQRDAADHGEHLERHREHQTRGEQLAEAVLDLHGGDHAGRDDEQIEHQDRHQAGQSQFLAHGRVDVIGIRDRCDRRMALAQAVAHQASGGQSENAGDQLVGTAVFLVVLRGIERMQPCVDARAHVAEDVRRRHGAHGERDETDENPAFASRGDIQHGDEHREEHQRGAQIVLHDEHAHRHDPHHDDRPQILDARKLETEHLLAADRELVAVVEQIGGEEERQEQLGELTRLERTQSGDLHPDARAVLLGTQSRAASETAATRCRSPC